MKTILKKMQFFAFALIQLYAVQTVAQVTADFTVVGNKKGCSPLVVNFSNQSTGATNYIWRFGNGNQSSLQNPSVIYATPGKYTITLIATSGSFSDTMTKTDFIEIFQDPTADFTAVDHFGCAPFSAVFNEASTPGSAPIRAWIWNFGDGASSNQKNPSHTFSQSGNFNITLLVVDQNGCSDEKVIPQYIQVLNKPVAQFNAPNRSSCVAPFNVAFTNQSQPNNGLTYAWNFGDGATSTQNAPNHTYNTMGNFNVKLKVTNSLGCSDSIVKNKFVTIQELVAGFTANVTQGCAPFTVNFTNQSTSNPSSVLWDFGDNTTSTAKNPSKTYTQPGIYTVKMKAANSSACSDSIIKVDYIVVEEAPIAEFLSNNTTGCKTPFVGAFNDNSTGAVSWLWNFGNGASSGQQNPVTVFNSIGNFDVSLTVTNAAGCTHTTTKNDFIKINPPQVDFIADTTRGCFPLEVNFTSNATANEPIVSYQWNFGDGNFSNQISPSHIYSVEGEFDVQLVITTVSGCADTVLKSKFVKAGSKPNADFFGVPTTVCLFTPVNFTNLTDVSDQWFWQFGDGGISTEMSPAYTYGDTGVFSINLIVWNKGCADTIEKINYITVSPPDARFKIERNCADPFTITLIDTSLAPDTWFWDFGDGDTSTLQHPVHTYASKGTYDVSLMVTDTFSGCTDVLVKTVLVVDALANFEANPTSGCHPLQVSATDLSVDGNSYLWESAGMTSTQVNPNFTYTVPGIYDMKLVVTDLLGCADSLTISDYITVLGPIANFGGDPKNGCAPLQVNFLDSSYAFLSDVVSWSWDFGNGETSTLQNPSVNYENPGKFTVSVTVLDTNGCSNTKTVVDFIQPTFPTPVFSADTFSCSSRAITFNNQSVGTGLSFEWDFGDATQSTNANPTHLFAQEGTYSITLRVIDANGCDSTVTKTNYITVSDPVVEFGADSTFSPCPPLVVDFTNLSSADVVSYEWDFGDGNFSNLDVPSNVYLTPGNFDVQLIGTTALGCKDTVVKNDFILILGPDGTFTFDPTNSCLGFDINFFAQTTNTAFISWDFGDGNVDTNSDDTLAHVYQQSGIYHPAIILDDGLGCVRAITSKDSIIVGELNANFVSNTNYLCKQGTVQFADLSIGIPAIQSWFWDFGDGSTSTQQNPLHLYTQSGNYDVMLIVSSSLCLDTIIKPNAVIVDAGPTADFEASNYFGCDSMMINFEDKTWSDTTLISWFWNFKNGNTASQSKASAFFNTPGSFEVELIVMESTGCADTISKTIIIFSSPIIQVSPDAEICKGDTTQLNASGAIAYRWLPADDLNADDISNPIAVPSQSTNYSVIGTDANGCSATAIVSLLVHPIPDGKVIKKQSICIGQSVELWADGGSDYLWSPAGSLSGTSTSNVIAKPLTDTEYIVRIGNSFGCYDFDTILVEVHAYPEGILEDSIKLCFGDSAAIEVLGGSNITWLNSAGLSCNDCANPTTLPNATTTYKVMLSNIYGCAIEDSIAVVVNPNAEPEIVGDENVCLGNEAILTASGGTIFNWLSPVDLNCKNCEQQAILPIENTTYIVEVNNEFNCPKITQFSVSVRPIPTVTTIADTKFCSGNQILLNTQSTNAVSHIWSPDIDLSNSQIQSPMAQPKNSTTYVVIAISEFGCVSSDSVYIEVIEKVKTNVVGDLEICIGESTQLFTTILEEDFSGSQVFWSPANHLEGNTSLEPIVSPKTTTTYTLIAKSGTCIPDTQKITVIVNDLPKIEIIQDRKVSTGTKINLHVESDKIIEVYDWQPQSIIDCGNCETVHFTAQESAEVKAEVTDINGCKNNDVALIDVVGNCGDDIFIPNTFTPNGDELNDKLVVRNLSLDGLKIFRIFDRWGNLVFETNDINQGWNGTYKGKILNTGVFVYYVEAICSNGLITSKKGNVTLLK